MVALLYIMLICAMVILAVFRPGIALAATLGLHVIERMGEIVLPLLVTYALLNNLLLALVVGVAFCSAYVRGERPLGGYPLAGWLTVFLYCYCGISVVWSISPEIAFPQLRSAAPYFILATLVCPLTLNNSRQLGFGLISALFICTATLGCILLVGEFEGRMLQASQVRDKEAGPLMIGSAGAYVTVIAALLNPQRNSMIWFVWRWVAVAVGTAAIVQTGSRGQMVAMLPAILLMLPVSRSLRSVRGAMEIGAGIIIVAAICVFHVSRTSVYIDRWAGDQMVSSYEDWRIGMSKIVLKKWSRMPQAWLVGYGNSASQDPTILGNYPHVVIVEALVEEGVIGFTLFSAIMGLALASLWRSVRKVRESEILRGQLACLGALFLTSLILSFKQGTLLNSYYLFGFAIMVCRFERMLNRDVEGLPFSDERFILETSTR